MALVSAIFQNYDAASRAINDLENAGFRHEQISVVMTDEARGKHFKLREDNKSDEGVATGASLGGVAGAIAGLVAGAGVLTIPGLNLVVAGSIVSTLAGLGAGAAAGGFLGGLVGAGIPEHEAKFYDKEIRSGNVLLAVDTDDHKETKIAKDILDNLGVHTKAA